MSEQTYNLDDLAHYVVLGTTKDGKPVTVRSEAMTLQDMVALLARADLSVRIETAKVALESYRRDREAMASPIIKPGHA